MLYIIAGVIAVIVVAGLVYDRVHKRRAARIAQAGGPAGRGFGQGSDPSAGASGIGAQVNVLRGDQGSGPQG